VSNRCKKETVVTLIVCCIFRCEAAPSIKLVCSRRSINRLVWPMADDMSNYGEQWFSLIVLPMQSIVNSIHTITWGSEFNQLLLKWQIMSYCIAHYRLFTEKYLSISGLNVLLIARVTCGISYAWTTALSYGNSEFRIPEK
jgi:hypothetical protein